MGLEDQADRRRLPTDGLDPDEFRTLGDLVERWSDEERNLRTWLEGVTDLDLAARPPGADDPLSMWRYLVCVITQGIQLYSEAAALLTRAGHSPGEIGYLDFCSNPGDGRT